MPRLQAKSFGSPDETRALPRATARVVYLDETAVGFASWEPGWRWSVDLKPIVGTSWCEHHHLGYALSGSLEVVSETGEGLTIHAGRGANRDPAGTRCLGRRDEPFVTVEWSSSRLVGVGPDDPGHQYRRHGAVHGHRGLHGPRSSASGTKPGEEVLIKHNARMRETVDRYRGREVARRPVTGSLVAFDGATRAVRCGSSMIQAAERLGLRIRVGIHTGEVEVIADDIRGVAVHTAARVMAVAGPTRCSCPRRHAALSDGSGLTFEDAGAHPLKGLVGDRRVYRLVRP